MSDWWLNVLATCLQIAAAIFALVAAVLGVAGVQIAAAIFALVAAVLGVAGTYFNQQLTARSGEIITRLDHQVKTVIGDEWKPLSVDQIEQLRLAIETWHKPDKIQVMYENEFGKDLAQSIAIAFKAAGWNVSFSTGGGFGHGIEVGPGPDGVKMKEIIARLTQSSDVRNLRPDEPDMGIRFIGVGAKVE